MNTTPMPGRRSLCVLCALACLAVSMPNATGAGTTPGGKPGAAAGKPVAGRNKKPAPPTVLTPADVNRELIGLLIADRMPWAFFGQYAGFYRQFAEDARRQKAAETKTPAVARETPPRAAGSVADVYDGTAKLLETMAKNRRTIDEIRNNTSTVPPPERREVYKAAMAAYQVQQAELLARLGAAAPAARAGLAASSAAPGTPAPANND